MALDRNPDARADPDAVSQTAHPRSLRRVISGRGAGRRRLPALTPVLALGILLAALAARQPAQAHWVDPALIVDTLGNDAQLRQQLGVSSVNRDRRLLIIRVQRRKWDSAAEPLRLRLASEWRDAWRHNVPNGIVAVVDAADDTPVVHYDRRGLPHLSAPSTPAATPIN